MVCTIVNALREIKGEKCIMSGYWRPDESKHTPRVRRHRRQVCVWRNIQDALDKARDPSRNLLEMPPVLYWQAETGRYRRSRGKIPTKIQQEDFLRRGIVI